MARKRAVGASAAVATAAVAAQVGSVGGDARVRRELGNIEDPKGFEHQADRELWVTADDGVSLHVEVDEPRGPAAKDPRPTVVIAHGYTLCLRSWVLQRRALTAAGYRVVLWDQRSHGRSARSAPEHATIDQLGRDLKAVLDATCPAGELVLVGHSMGGMTLMALARRHPELVRDRVVAVAFVATSAGGTDMTNLGFGPLLGRAISRVGPGVLARLGRHQGWLDGIRRFGRNLEDNVVAHWSFDSPVSEETVRFAGDLIFATPFSVMADFMPALDHLDERDSLATFHGIETLVLNGEGDLMTPPDHSDGIVQRIPGAEHVVVAEAGHLVMLEHPEVVTQQLLMLAERGQRAVHAGVPVSRKPRVRRTITDLAKRRRVRSAREAAS